MRIAAKALFGVLNEADSKGENLSFIEIYHRARTRQKQITEYLKTLSDGNNSANPIE